MKLVTLSLLSALFLSALPLSAELVDNPAYQNWAKYKPGTFTQMKGQTSMGEAGMGLAMESETKHTLLALTPEKATVEVQTSANVGGRKMPPRTIKHAIPAKVEKGKENMPDLPGTPMEKAEVKDVKLGTDTLTIKDQTLKTNTYEATIVTKGSEEMPAMTMQVKTWTSPEIPGGMVKSETTVTGEMKSTISMNLVDYKVAK